MNDDDNIDDNFDAIEAIKHQPAAPPPAPEPVTIGADYVGGKGSEHYNWWAGQFAAGEAARQAASRPKTLESKFYGTKT